MRNEVRYIVQIIFLKKHENLNLFKYDHDVHRIIDFIYSVFSHYLDNIDIDNDNTNTYIINYNYQIKILLIYEKLHYYIKNYTIIFFIVYIYLHTKQYLYNMLFNNMNIAYSEVGTFMNQYYIVKSLSIYYYVYLHVMCYSVIFYPLHLYVFVLICQYYVVLFKRTNKDIIYISSMKDGYLTE